MSRIPGNVQRGAEFLDEKLGPDWDEAIVLHRLDLGDTCNCVVGQLMRHEVPNHRRHDRYSLGLEKMGVTQPGRLGFSIWGRQGFYHLTFGWRRLIAARRRARREQAA